MASFALLLVALAPTATALLRGTGQMVDLNLNLMLSDMHPDAVGRLLSQVGKRWEEERVSALRNQTTESVALSEMTKSCEKVVKAIVDGSDGDKDRVVEYMDDVCQSSSKAAADEREKCEKFSAGIDKFLSDDAELNRNGLKFAKFCEDYWTTTVTVLAKVEAHRLDEADAVRAKEEAERQEQEQKEREQREKEESERAFNQTQAAQEEDLQTAVNKTQQAQADDAKISEEVQNINASMAADDEGATKLVDRARMELQAASEKEASAAEAKATETSANDVEAAKAEGDATADAIVEKAEAKAAMTEAEAKKSEADEAAALAAGDKEADAIAAKAEAKTAEEPPKPKEESAAAEDDAKAKAAGDALAEKIEAKAEKKVAALATKKNAPAPKKA